MFRCQLKSISHLNTWPSLQCFSLIALNARVFFINSTGGFLLINWADVLRSYPRELKQNQSTTLRY